MENSIYIGLSKQIALQNNMDTIANNIANMSTSGYRTQNLLFEEFLDKERGDYDPMSFVYDRGQYESTEPGSLSFTGNSLDAALAGPGFFGVQGPDGKVGYSRAGNFQMDANGRLLNAAGYPVVDQGGSPISIPQGSTEIKIDEKGFISNQDGQIAQLMVVEFSNQQDLKPTGNNIYTTTAGTLSPTNTRVKQGEVEGSNVKPVLEMTRMVETLRAFQSVQNVIQSEHERLQTAIQKLTKA